jgi:hypothetical protein
MKRRSALSILLSTLPLAAQQPAPRKLETLLLLPEPRALRGPLSLAPEESRQTVLTPAQETEDGGIKAYTAEEFARLGFSVETFAKRAASAADKRLTMLKPEIIRDASGRVAYAVYRGESSLFASLLVAPSLPKIFEPMFGKELWAALPDRHALYIFPAQSAALQDFSADLAERFAADAFAASPEIFSLKAGEPPRVIATFAGKEL